MAIALTGTAQAAGTSIDPASVLTAPASAYDWTGFYAGVTGGLGAGNVTIMMFDRPYPQNISGGLFGGTIGYNHQWNTFVLGIEGDLAGSGLAGLPVDASGVDADTIATTINWIGTARVRAGVSVDKALLYVTAGIAAGSATTVLTVDSSGYPATLGYLGWTFGAGVEVSVTDDVSLKAEYSMIDLGTTRDGGLVLGSPSAPADIRPVVHIFKLGANWHF